MLDWETRRPKRRVPLPLGAAIVLGFVLFLTYATALALADVGRAFPGLLVDPYGSFSAVRAPTWQPAGSLKFPARVVALDGHSLEPPGGTNAFVAPDMRARVASVYHAGAKTVSLTFAMDGHRHVLKRKIELLTLDDIVFFFVFYALIGTALFGSAVAVHAIGGFRPAPNAYVVWASGMAVFLVSFYDYHSTTRLVPAFIVGTVGTSIGFLWLAWVFPSTPSERRALKAVLTGTGSLCCLAGAALLVARDLPWDLTPLRLGVNALVLLSMLALAVAIASRMRAAISEGREQLRVAGFGLLLTSAVLVVGFGAALSGITVVHIALPAVVSVMPLAIGYAIVRHDILRTRAVLTRGLVLLPVIPSGAAAGVLAWLGLVRWHGVVWGDMVSLLVALLVATGSAVLGYRLLVRHLLPAARQYRPTIDQLSSRLGSLRDEAAIREELVQVVRTWLPTTSVVLLAAQAPLENAAQGRDIAAGLPVTVSDENGGAGLLVPLRFQDQLCGTFSIGPKVGGALFTSDDIALLQTIAALGALALAHSSALSENDRLRRAQVDASRDERTLVVDTLSAEIAHELGHPLRYFRSLFEERTAKTILSQEEIGFARAQVERMDRMLATLQTLEIAPPSTEPVILARPIEHSLLLLRESFESSGVRVESTVPETIVVDAEHDPLVQVFANLLRNAAQAAAPNGCAGVRCRELAADLIVEVWDSGPGVSDAVKADLFRVWGVTTRRGGKGLGLMVTTRILRRFNWKIDFCRDHGETRFRITIPGEARWSHEDPHRRRRSE